MKFLWLVPLLSIMFFPFVGKNAGDNPPEPTPTPIPECVVLQGAWYDGKAVIVSLTNFDAPTVLSLQKIKAWWWWIDSVWPPKGYISQVMWQSGSTQEQIIFDGAGLSPFELIPENILFPPGDGKLSFVFSGPAQELIFSFNADLFFTYRARTCPVHIRILE